MALPTDNGGSRLLSGLTLFAAFAFTAGGLALLGYASTIAEPGEAPALPADFPDSLRQPGLQPLALISLYNRVGGRADGRYVVRPGTVSGLRVWVSLNTKDADPQPPPLVLEFAGKKFIAAPGGDEYAVDLDVPDLPAEELGKVHPLQIQVGANRRHHAELLVVSGPHYDAWAELRDYQRAAQWWQMGSIIIIPVGATLLGLGGLCGLVGLLGWRLTAPGRRNARADCERARHGEQFGLLVREGFQEGTLRAAQLAKEKRFAEAAKRLKLLLELANNNPGAGLPPGQLARAYQLLGTCLFALSEAERDPARRRAAFAEVVGAYEAAARFGPGDGGLTPAEYALACGVVGRDRLLAGDCDGAIAFLERAVAHRPDDEKTLLALAEAYGKRQRFEDEETKGTGPFF